jgi:hypothetical protein
MPEYGLEATVSTTVKAIISPPATVSIHNVDCKPIPGLRPAGCCRDKIAKLQSSPGREETHHPPERR